MIGIKLKFEWSVTVLSKSNANLPHIYLLEDASVVFVHNELVSVDTLCAQLVDDFFLVPSLDLLDSVVTVAGGRDRWHFSHATSLNAR